MKKPKEQPKPLFTVNDWVRIISGPFFDCIGQVARVELQPCSPQPMYRVGWIGCVDGRPAWRRYGNWHDESALESVDAKALIEGSDFATTACDGASQ